MNEETNTQTDEIPPVAAAPTGYAASAGEALYDESMKPWGLRPPRFATLCGYDKARLERMAQAAISWDKARRAPPTGPDVKETPIEVPPHSGRDERQPTGE